MALDTQTFGISQHWLSVALRLLPNKADIFANGNLSFARKSFLAGGKQLLAIKNWLSNAGLIQLSRGKATLTDLGKFIAAQDARCEHPWTWWLFHLNLCVNPDSFPYSAFFLLFEASGHNWLTPADVVEALTERANETGNAISASSVDTYFQGVDRVLRPGSPIYGLGLVERRLIQDEGAKLKLRRCISCPADTVIAYATMLFRNKLFTNQETIESRLLLSAGLGRSLGLTDAAVRDALTRINQHQRLGEYLQYTRVANLDSVQFRTNSLHGVSRYGYSDGEIRWP